MRRNGTPRNEAATKNKVTKGENEMKPGILAGALLAAVLSGSAFAQGAAIKLADVAELSGGGATVGTNWKNGIDLAIEEINAKGGILGHKLEVTHADSQSNPGVARAQV